MRRTAWPLLGLALVAALAAHRASAASDDPPAVEKLGDGPAYKALAALPVQHEGRVKPLDTLAREEIKQIHGRERVALKDEDGIVFASWDPVAAVLDWSARPDYWDGQPIIKVEFLPLKRAILAEPIKAALAEIAAKPTTPAPDREAIERVARLDEVDRADLRPLLGSKTLPEADLRAIARLDAKLGEGRKCLAPDELTDARVRVDGRLVPFAEWVDGLSDRDAEARRATGSDAKLADVERTALDVGMALARYRQLRDLELRGFLPIRVAPRPSNPAYVAYSGATVRALQASREERELPPVQTDLLTVLAKYKENIQTKDWALPGSNPEFDARYASWLASTSAWVPLPVLLKSDAAELAKAGYPASPVAEFRSAFARFVEAERSSPGRVDEASALAVVAAARDLGEAINAKTYPSPKAMAREVGFNATGPFWWAPFAYGLGAVLLALSLTVQSYRSSIVVAIRKGLYWGGLAGFVGGIGLEVYGFTLRVLITGWAPVTNMYETVIWVALVSSVIGLILEAVYRRTFAALAAAGIATVATSLAATIPLLDPTIRSIPPVLRSNLWLTIHVLTIVSSYAAFALTMGLGLIATGYYLTATYRRSAGFAALLVPILPGLPVLAAGGLLLAASHDAVNIGRFAADYGFWPGVVLFSVGFVTTLMCPIACLGEFLDRALHAEALAPATNPTVRREPDHRGHGVRELVEAGGPLPPVAGGSDEADDPRTLAMRGTAARIKPLTNFIYRAMQVGVLLVAAGTILGGVWADYSWGRFWGWDAKEVWALVTLLVYLVPLHGRFAGWVNTFGLVMASVVCFLSVLMAWYGVNFVLGVGLHTYGFGDGSKGQGSVGLATLCVLSFAAAAAWRRSLCQRAAA